MNKFKENLKKIWSKITESKLNISMFIAGVIAFALMAVILGIIIHRDGQVNNELIITGEKNNESMAQTTEATTEDERETTSKTEEQYSTKIDESATTNVVSKASRLSASASINNRWTNDGEYFIQYDLEVTNISDNDIDGWALVLDMSGSYTLVDSWNYTFKSGNKKLIINPLNDNRKIPAGETVSGGFIVKGTSYVRVDYITVYVGDKIETIKNGNTYVPATTTVRSTRDDSTTTIKNEETTTIPAVNAETTTADKPDNQQPESTTNNQQPESTTNNQQPESKPDNQQPPIPDNQQPTPVPDNQQPESNKPNPTTTQEIITSTKTEIITPEN